MCKPVRLNIGCGDDIRPGYLNIDPFADGPVLRMEAARLGFTGHSVDEIFSSHMLEHLSKHEVMDVLVEWNRVLKPTGKVEIVVPDLPWCLEQWLRLPEQARWDWALDTIFGLQNHPGGFHKTGFSGDRLHHLLKEAGFQWVKVNTCFDHGMQSIRALASAGDAAHAPLPDGCRAANWIRKQLVFLFYGLARIRTFHRSKGKNRSL